MIDESPDMSTLPTGRLSRRTLIGYSAGAIAGSALTAKAITASAQEATPEATPESRSEFEPSGIPPVPESLGPAVPPEFTEPTNWPAENYDLANTRRVTSSISTETIGQLGTAWTVPITTPGTFGAVTSAPIIVDNTLYMLDMQSNVWAYDKTTGEQRWVKNYNVNCAGPNGAAAGYGLLVFPLSDTAEMVALDLETGDEKWRVGLPQPRHEGITMGPLIYDSTVYVSTVPINGTHGLYLGGQRGMLYALDLNTGEVLWFFDTTTDNLWGNFRVNSGGGLWHPPAIDENGMLYAGIANPAPYPGTPDFPAASSRLGDNLYTNSAIRIDPVAGKVDWYVSLKPHDLFDADNHLSPVLTSAAIGGVETPLVISTGKHAFVAGIHRETGKEIWKTPVGVHINDMLDTLPADDEDPIEVAPGVIGGVETPIALGDGAVYTACVNVSAMYTGSTVGSNPFSEATSNLTALDVATGEIIWDKVVPTCLLGGVIAVNDVVLTAGLDGLVRGFSAADGSEIFRYQTTSGINAPISMSGDYVYIPSSGPFYTNSDVANPAPEQAAALVALKIGGEVQPTPAASPTA